MSEQEHNMKAEILAAVDEKLDIEAVAQMVEQLDHTKKINTSIQQSFQNLRIELQQKDQMIQYLRGRLDNLELDIMLLKRAVASPSPFAPLPQQNTCVPKDIENRRYSNQRQSVDNVSHVRPPDFSMLRKMTVSEPVNKFVPSMKEKQETVRG